MEKYYIGYVRNPEQIKKDDFTQIDEVKILIEEKENVAREFFSKGKIFIEERPQVFDGNKLNIGNYGFVGRKEKELTLEEVKKYLNSLNEYEQDKLLENIRIINLLTVKKALEQRYAYIMDELNFIKSFDNSNDSMINNTKIRKN